MPLLPTPGGNLEYLVTGAGAPVTVFAHGLAGSIAETRPLGSAVAGTRVFFHFRGHGGSAVGESPWSYPELAAELTTVADHVGAARAVGVSLGAGALTALLADAPGRFERLAFFLPAVRDEPRREAALDRLREMATYVDGRDEEGLVALLLAEQPAGVRDRADVLAFVRRQARSLLGSPVSAALRAMPDQVPIPDRRVLARVTAPALVIGQQGDTAHPVWVAEQMAAVLPAARLHVFGAGGALWSARAELRSLIAGFLNGA